MHTTLRVTFLNSHVTDYRILLAFKFVRSEEHVNPLMSYLLQPIVQLASEQIWASSGENLSSGISDQVRLKPACSPTDIS